MITIICLCTLYEDKIILHNSFINVLFNELIQKIKKVAMTDESFFLFPIRAQRVKNSFYQILNMCRCMNINTIKSCTKEMLLYKDI